jgi:acid phosphatase type 7
MSDLKRMLNAEEGQKQNRNSRTSLYLFMIAGILLVSGCVPQAGTSIPTKNPPSPAASSTEVVSRAASPTGTSTASPSMEPTASPSVVVPITLNPDQDAYVKRLAPYANFGDDQILRVDGGGNPEEAFLRFTVASASGTIQSARLRLYTGGNSTANGPAIFTTDASWSEKDITWNNRPAHGSDGLDNKDQMDATTWVEYDVSSVVTGPGTFDFVLAADSDDATEFSAREGTHAPELVIALNTDQVAPTSTPSTADVILVGAGDISTCANDNDELTAKLLDSIAGTVFTTGNNAYDDGTYQEFKDCYGPTWGRHKDRTYPVPGNIEYHTKDAGGYFEYFNSIPPYYAYDLGKWRIYALNADMHVGETSKQVKWLTRDLATHPNQCVLAYWHTPRWSSGSTHGSNEEMQVLWQTLYDSGAELVLNSFEHNYERFTPMNANGQADPQGLREIVVGTGGAKPTPFGPPLPTSEVRNNSTYGVLKLTLHEDSYDWQFIPVAGSTFTDSGSTQCHE